MPKGGAVCLLFLWNNDEEINFKIKWETDYFRISKIYAILVGENERGNKCI